MPVLLEPLTSKETAKLKKLSSRLAADLSDKQAKKLKKLKKRAAAAPAGSTADAKKSKSTAAPSDVNGADRPSAESSAQREHPSYATFAEAPFAPKLKEVLKKIGFAAPTPIQARAWPAALSGCNLVAVAKTGSGKTLAFALPVLHTLATTRGSGSGGAATPRALVLSPTRELATQITEACERFASAVGVCCACVYGGTPVHAQKAALKSAPPDLVVATPGRLVDLISEGHRALSLGGCASLVLDEADRMLDMGFEPQLKKIFAALPTNRQTLLFTATWPKSVRKLATEYVGGGDGGGGGGGGGSRELLELFLDGGEGEAAELAANKAVSQSFVHATDDEKDNKLWKLLCELKEGSRVIVFANTKRRVEKLSKDFVEFGTCAIHGDKQQHEREAGLRDFKQNKRPLMFATDVAARGLDISGVTHVINFDMAKDVESYVHRIGRTGRAGESGTSVTFWNPDYDKECAPALAKIARDAAQEVPEWLGKFEKQKASKQWDVAKAASRGVL